MAIDIHAPARDLAQPASAMARDAKVRRAPAAPWCCDTCLAPLGADICRDCGKPLCARCAVNAPWCPECRAQGIATRLGREAQRLGPGGFYVYHPDIVAIYLTMSRRSAPARG